MMTPRWLTTSCVLALVCVSPSFALAQDSDGDGLSDVDEITTYMSNPADPDSDGDGLTDGYEVLRLGSSPTLVDSDSAGVPDGVEYAQGTNPAVGGDDDASAAARGAGYVSAWAGGQGALASLADADAALAAATSLSYRHDGSIDYSDGDGVPAGDYDQDLFLRQVFALDATNVAARFGALLVVSPAAPGATDNVRTFAVGADEGWRLEVWDGAAIRSASAEQVSPAATGPLLEVSFPLEGGLFPASIVYYEGTQRAGLEWSWAQGSQATFDASTFSLVPSTSMLAPELAGTHTVTDTNGGAPEQGDVLEVSVTVRNDGDAPAYGVRVRPVLANASFGAYSSTPANSAADPMDSSVLVVPVLEPNTSVNLSFTASVTGGAGDAVSIQSAFSADLSDVGVGAASARASSDELAQTGGSVVANAPFGLDDGAGSDDDPTLLVVGSSVAAPTVAIGSPSSGDRFATNSLSFSGTSSGAQELEVLLYDAVGDLSVISGNVDLGTGSWSASLSSLSDGDYAAVVVARNSAGVEDAELVRFTVNALPPTLGVLSPNPGDRISDVQPTFLGNSDPGQVIELTLDGQRLADVTASASGSWSSGAPSALAEGPHTLVVSATDADMMTSSRTIPFDVDTSNAVAITDPTDGQTLIVAQPTFQGTAEVGAFLDVSVRRGPAVVFTTQVFSVPASGTWSVTSTVGFTDGSYDLQVSSRDLAGNLASDSVSFDVDLAAPSISFTYPSDGLDIDTATPTLTGQAEPGADVFVSVDSAPEVAAAVDAVGAWSLAITSPLSEGSHSVSVRAEDAAGNSSPTVTNTFDVDLTGPSVVFTTPTDGQVFSSTSFDIEGTSEPFALVEVVVDGAPQPAAFADGTGAWSISPGPTLTEGAHSISATSTDGVGNEGPVSSVSVEVDLTDPVVVFTSPTPNTRTADTTPEFVGTTEPLASVEIRVDNIKLSDVPADMNGDWSFTVPNSAMLGDGSHGVSARATDRAGRRSLFASVPFVVDTQPPSVTIDSPADGDTILSSIRVLGSVSEPGSTVSLVLDPGAGETVLAPVTSDAAGAWFVDVDGLAAGPLVLEARAIDAAGNEGASMTSAITVSGDPLSLTFPIEGQVVADSTPVLRGQAAPAATVSVTFDADAASAASVVADDQGRWALAAPELSEGAHTVVVADGPISLSRGFSVDTRAPGLLFDAPADGASLAQLRPVLSGITAPTQPVSISLDGVELGQAVADGVGSFSLTPGSDLDEGHHDAVATVCDGAGNCASDYTSFFVDFTPPALSILAPAADSTTSDPTPLVSGTAEPRSTLEISVDARVVSTFVVGDDGVWSYQFLSALLPGTRLVEVSLRDAAGNQTEDSVSFDVDTSRPAISVDAPRDGSFVSVDRPMFSGSANAMATIDVAIDMGVPSSVTADADGRWSLASPVDLTPGTHTVTATFDNGSGPVVASSTFEVDLVAPGAQWTSPADGARVSDRTPRLTASTEPGAVVLVTLPDADTLALVADAQGDVVIDTPAPFSDDDYVFSLVALDPAGNRSAVVDLNVTIDTVAEVAVFHPDADSVVSAGDLEVTGRAEPGANVDVAIDGSSVGSVTAGVDGSFSVTAPALAPGAHDLLVRSTDALGNLGQASADFIADERVPTLALTSPLDGDVVATDLVPITGITAPGVDVSLTLDGDPLADVTAGADGSFSFTPSVDSPLPEGDHVLVATVDGTDGLVATSRSSFTIDLPDSELFVDAPTPNSTTTDETPAITGRADAGVAVSIEIDDRDPVSLDAGDDGSWSYTVPDDEPLADGMHILFVSSELGARVGPFAFFVDAGAISISFTSPRTGEVLGDSTPVFTGTADPDAVVSLYIDDVEVDDAFIGADGTWTFELVDPLSDGIHGVEAVSRFGLKSASTGTRPFEIDTTPPEVAIISPAAGGSTENDPFFTGTSEPNASIAISVDGVGYESARASADGEWRLKVPSARPLTAGQRTLTVTATDRVGNTSEPVSVTFTVLAPEGSSGGGVGADPSDEGCCATTPSTPRQPPLALLALVALVAWRRRR